jgi:signal-transduction protein with cAMP-binding, CBS, and nucleotidyltransferase domain
LIAHIASSISFELLEEGSSVMRQDAVSSGIYFIYRGSVQAYWRENEEMLFCLEEGSYFGDISFIF